MLPHAVFRLSTARQSSSIIRNVWQEKRFTNVEIHEIRASRESARAIAERFGVTFPVILNIKSRKTYKHIPDPLDGEGRATDVGESLYLRMKPLDFMRDLPDGHCQTVVTSPPSKMGMRVRRTYVREQDDHLGRNYPYIKWQREVLAECSRIAGPEGIVIYHRMVRLNRNHPDIAGRLMVQDFRRLLEDEEFPGRRVIIRCNHGPPEVTSGSSRADPWEDPAVPYQSVLLLCPGGSWTLPEGVPTYPLEDDEWYFTYDYETDYLGKIVKPDWPLFPEKLADRCISFGGGRVLDPFANVGSHPPSRHQGRTSVAGLRYPLPPKSII